MNNTPELSYQNPANQLALAKQVNWLGIWLVIYQKVVLLAICETYAL
jgi:hypothetical protein